MVVDWDEIKKEYIDSKGEVVLKELAEKHKVKDSTLRSRKNREKWDDEIKDKHATSHATQRKKNKNVATQDKNDNAKKQKVKTLDEDIVNKVIDNELLTDKQQLFCIHYIRCFNATKAYQKAYQCSYNTAMVEGFSHLRNPKIKDQISKLKQHRFNRAMLSEDDLFQVMMDIAFAEVTDYMEFGTEDVPDINHMTGEQEIDKEGNPIFYKRNYLHFNNSSEVDGSLISEVSQGKDGVKVKLHDKMKALQWLSDRMELLTTYNKEKLQLEKDKLDHIKGKDNQTDKPIEILIKRKEKR